MRAFELDTLGARIAFVCALLGFLTGCVLTVGFVVLLLLDWSWATVIVGPFAVAMAALMCFMTWELVKR